MTSTAPTQPTGVAPMRFGVVDLETSGLSIDRHRILQVGLVVVEIDPTAPSGPTSHDPARIVDRWATMVRLRWPWQRLGARHLHGIRRRDLRGAPRLAETLAELARRLDGSIFTAHNAAFDGGFLRHAASREGVALDLGPHLCTLRLSRRLDPDRRDSHRLGDLCERYEVTLDRPHDALDDALATAALLPHLLRAHGITDPDQLGPFYDRPSPAPSPAASPAAS
ncbi:MAG: 3'-5' exonuclease [Ilumatobacteraceae bacterium]